MGDYTLTPVDHDPFADEARATVDANTRARMFGDGSGSGVLGNPAFDKPAMLAPYTPTFSERVGDAASGAMRGLGASRDYADSFGSGARTLAGLTPMSAGYDAGRSLGAGDYVGAAVNALGALPDGGAGLAALAGHAALPMAGRVAGDVVKAAEEAAPGITAYHGSPHSFDRFDISKIGTGEGAQAYGHGLYFAENEGIAKSYRDALSAQGATINGRPVSDIAAEKYRMGIRETPTDTHDIADYISSYQDNARSVMERKRPDLVPLYDQMKASGAINDKGSMYQVHIAANPDHFLDWDKPLSEQHPQIQGALSDLNVPIGGKWEENHNEPGVFTRTGARGQEATVRAIDRYGNGNIEWLASHDAGSQRFPTKEDAQHWIDTEAPIEAGRGAEIYQTLRKSMGNDADISAKLHKAGVPGIKYLDAGSRGVGDGSRNYVTFSDDIVNVIKKYGIAGLMAGGMGAHYMMTPVDHDPFAQASQ